MFFSFRFIPMVITLGGSDEWERSWKNQFDRLSGSRDA